MFRRKPAPQATPPLGDEAALRRKRKRKAALTLLICLPLWALFTASLVHTGGSLFVAALLVVNLCALRFPSLYTLVGIQYFFLGLLLLLFFAMPSHPETKPNEWLLALDAVNVWIRALCGAGSNILCWWACAFLLRE